MDQVDSLIIGGGMAFTFKKTVEGVKVSMLDITKYLPQS
jgi:3-phosphoglycerate kinase